MTNLIILFAASFIVFANFFAALTNLPVYVLELGGNEFHSGLQTTLFFVTAVVLRFYFGPYADRRGRKRPLLIGAFAFATAPVFFWLAEGHWWLALARMYQAVGLAAYFSSGSSLVADLAPKGRTGIYIGAYRLVNSLAFFAGQALFSKIIYSYSFKTWFLISLVTGLGAFCLINLLQVPALAGGGGDAFQVLNQIGSVLKERRLRPIFLGIGLTALCYGAIIAFGIIYISGIILIANPGIYFIYFGLAGAAANIANGFLSDRFGRPVIAWPSVMMVGLGALVLYFLPSWPATLVLSSFMAGFGFSGGLAVLIAWLVDLVDDRSRATTLAIQESIIDLSIALGSLVFGLTSGIIGLADSFAILGTLVFAIALFLLTRLIMPQKNLKEGEY